MAGVQSLERAFGLLEVIAAHRGAMSLSELATSSGLPPPTLHRLARTLVDLGYLRQEPSRRYALGPRLFLLAESSTMMLNAVALPHLSHLVDEIGETANLAMLDGDQVAYVAQAPGRHSMRMFTEVGRRVEPHCTAVGKALLAATTDEEARALLQRTGLPRHTPHTVTDLGEHPHRVPAGCLGDVGHLVAVQHGQVGRLPDLVHEVAQVRKRHGVEHHRRALGQQEQPRPQRVPP